MLPSYNDHAAAYIIGEVGSCHEGSLEIAKAMIRSAGSNAVKFQYFHSGKDVAARRKAPEYEAMYEKYRMPLEWLPLLAHEAMLADMDFLCTVYMPDDIAVVAPWVSAFKIASPDSLDKKFIKAHLVYNKPIIISTGLLTHEELLKVVALRAEIGFDMIKLLHCVSAYPCPVAEINLDNIPRYGLDGFSDHTAQPCMGALAYMQGARIFEAHIRHYETSKDNPDYPHALVQAQWSAYMNMIRMAEQAKGRRDKRTQLSEAPLRRFLA